jgi:hypothetical protein
MTLFKMLTPDDKLAEIRRLYFNATKGTIQQDLEKALDLLKSMASEDERERATVYMEGLAEMRSDWTRESGGSGKGRKKPSTRRNISPPPAASKPPAKRR